MVEGNHVVVLAVPDQAVGGGHIPPAPLTVHLLPGDVVVKIFEGNGLPAGNGGMELVHVVVDALVHNFNAPVNVYLPLKLACLVDAGQPLQLADQGVALLLGEEAGGLDRVHKQLHLGQFKIPLPHKPAGGLALPGLDIQAEQAEGLQVVVDAFALRFDVLAGQLLNDLGDGERVFFIGFPQEQAVKKEQLGLLITAFRHHGILLSNFHVQHSKTVVL